MMTFISIGSINEGIGSTQKAVILAAPSFDRRAGTPTEIPLSPFTKGGEESAHLCKRG